MEQGAPRIEATDSPPPIEGDEAAAPRSDAWVPVDRRWLGLDKRSFPWAFVVIGIAFVLGWVMPVVNSAYQPHDPIEAGDLIDLASGGLVFAPAPGWNLDEGLRYDPTRKEQVVSTSSVSKGDVQLSIRTGNFKGTPDELLDQINRENKDLEDQRGLGSASGRTSITVNGAQGVAETFTGLSEKGIVVALVYEVDGQSVGTEVTVRGSTASIDENRDEIAAMVDSIRLLQDNERGAGS